MKPAPPHGGHFRTRKLDLAEPTSLREKVSRPGPGVPEPQSPWDLGGDGALKTAHSWAQGQPFCIRLWDWGSEVTAQTSAQEALIRAAEKQRRDHSIRKEQPFDNGAGKRPRAENEARSQPRATWKST